MKLIVDAFRQGEIKRRKESAQKCGTMSYVQLRIKMKGSIKSFACQRDAGANASSFSQQDSRDVGHCVFQISA